jgi:2'-5' RNA ligase
MEVRTSTETEARLFFALVPPPPLQRVLGTLAMSVAQRARGRAIAVDNVHLTLAFVGAWPLAKLSQWTEAGARCAGAPIDVMLNRLGGFSRAGIAWIGPTSTPIALQRLATALAAELAAAGVAVEPRAFAAHITLARRCRGPFPSEPIGPYDWRVEALSLMRSYTERNGARYVEMERWPLRNA